MSMTSPDFIERLCLALAHRREPDRIFVVLTSAFNGSMAQKGGKGRSNPACSFLVTTGLMGSVAQWAGFQAGLDQLRATYGFQGFDGGDFNARAGEFKGWNEGRCSSLLTELSDLVSGKLMKGCVFPINRLEFKTDYKRDGRGRMDTEYGLSFRHCLQYLTDSAILKNSSHEGFAQTKMNVVLRSDQKGSADSTRIFFSMKKAYRSEGVELLDALALAERNDADPLMVADFLSQTIYEKRPDKWAYLSWPAGSDTPSTSLTHIGFTRGASGKSEGSCHEDKFCD